MPVRIDKGYGRNCFRINDFHYLSTPFWQYQSWIPDPSPSWGLELEIQPRNSTIIMLRGVCFSESFCRDEKFETLGSKIGAIDQVRQKSLSNSSHTISLSHTQMFGSKWHMFSESFCWDKKFVHWEAKSEQLTKITLKLKSHNLTLSRSHMIGTKWHMFF